MLLFLAMLAAQGSVRPNDTTTVTDIEYMFCKFQPKATLSHCQQSLYISTASSMQLRATHKRTQLTQHRDRHKIHLTECTHVPGVLFLIDAATLHFSCLLTS